MNHTKYKNRLSQIRTHNRASKKHCFQPQSTVRQTRNTVSSPAHSSGKEKTLYPARNHPKTSGNPLIFHISANEIRQIPCFLSLSERKYAENSVSSLFHRENNVEMPYLAAPPRRATPRNPFPLVSTLKNEKKYERNLNHQSGAHEQQSHLFPRQDADRICQDEELERLRK